MYIRDDELDRRICCWQRPNIYTYGKRNLNVIAVNKVSSRRGPRVVGSDFRFSTIMTIRVRCRGKSLLSCSIFRKNDGLITRTTTTTMFRRVFNLDAYSKLLSGYALKSRLRSRVLSFTARLADPHALNVSKHIYPVYLLCIYILCIRAAWAPRCCETRHRCCTRGVWYITGSVLVLLFYFISLPRAPEASVGVINVFYTYMHIDYSRMRVRVCVYIHVYRDVHDGGR